MALINRARGLAIAGVTSLAVVIPVSPVAPAATATAAPAVQMSVVSSSAAATPTAVSGLSRKVAAGKVMRKARSLKGIPYRYGGSTPRGFDCSGFTMYVFRKAVGKKLPHSATQQMHKARKISRQKAKRGDLVFFRSGSMAYHVGIYAGKNRVLHSPRPGRVVKTEKIWTSNVTFGRLL